MSYFKNKVIWITGASSGIGREAAFQLNKLGAKLILSARDKTKLSLLKEELGTTEKVLVCPLDLTKEESLEKAVDLVYTNFDKVDILFNSAGLSQRSTALETEMAVDRELMEVNYFGAVGLTKKILPKMISAGGGHFVVLSSVVGKFGFSMRSAYAAAKHALHGFFDSLFFENHTKGIKVTMIVSGPIQTDISLHAINGKGKVTGQMDEMQKEGIAVEKAVNIMLNAIAQQKKEIIIGGFKEKLGVKLRALWPSLFYKLTAKQDPQGKV